MNNPLAQFLVAIDKVDREIDIPTAALYIAQVEYPELEIERYQTDLANMAKEIAQRLPTDRYPLKVIQTINEYLYDELGFHGNKLDYYNPCNSLLNDAIDRRTGIPITLAVIYLEIAKQIGFPMVGIGMPGHFLIRPNFEGAGIFVDVFDRGEILFVEDCRQKLMQIYQQDIPFLPPEILQPVTNRQILLRILNNLQATYLYRPDFDRASTIKHWIESMNDES
ncbi:transglutaminase-like domain-containing protein [Chamaesiphon sp. VAR_69_metabat_338]|uniref:SirB1 family protein n=1 Tax=Chamaesiphon sp. VAR_69_metabat_338 TaxID=2964704 RepID=UPI00286DF7E7|nr:transglutaminase-like domain-containing protein [Chamaesiphon sp. VAR_69_metabat_338]